MDYTAEKKRELRKAKKMGKVEPKVRVKSDIRPGESTPAQWRAWQRFWQRMIAEAKADAGIGKPGIPGVEYSQHGPDKEDGQ